MIVGVFLNSGLPQMMKSPHARTPTLKLV